MVGIYSKWGLRGPPSLMPQLTRPGISQAFPLFETLHQNEIAAETYNETVQRIRQIDKPIAMPIYRYACATLGNTHCSSATRST
jgi:hypothetical protein